MVRFLASYPVAATCGCGIGRPRAGLIPPAWLAGADITTINAYQRCVTEYRLIRELLEYAVTNQEMQEMSDYQAPVKDMMFVINELAGIDQLNKLPGFEDATPELVEAVLEEAAQLATEVISPLNVIGDAKGTYVEDGQVFVSEEFKVAYQQFVAGGWGGISQSTESGGQGLPYLVGMAVDEMWESACLAWSICGLLSQGAARAIETYGSETLQGLVLEKLVSGEWTGTMVLTEPQAGSDLAAVRTQAVADGDYYRVTGQKIFITYGDHDMTDNIIHLVLARLPDAPPGVKGISLFAVPKYSINADGTLGERNNVTAVSVEHKLGIHGSPTCVLSFDGSLGEMVGEPNQGLACMFMMMNHARLGVGLEGVSIAERSYQQALAYAKERIQGQAAGHKGAATIIKHPDVRRMLMHMKSNIEAMRAIAYVTATDLDKVHAEADEGRKAAAQARLDLMTPIVKGWCTETGQVLASLGLQVHGGMGYVEETGAAQHFRDARITTIYEGTTGIQAGDLIGRKILRDRGQSLQAFIADVTETDAALARHADSLANIRAELQKACQALVGATQWLFGNFSKDANIPGAVSYNFLMLMGTVAGGWQLARAAVVAADHLNADTGDKEFYEAKIITARFFAEQVLPMAGAYRRVIESGSESIMALSEDQF
jgi:alkylation response protein AidB-like acyl-CoA dehydrogenase